MHPDYPQYWPFLIAALAVFLIYRRFRRSFGRQLLSPTRMRVRIGILALVGCSLLPAVIVSPRMMGAGIAGLAVGVSLAIWGAQRTRYQNYAGRLHYIPHTYTGIAVSLLFVGRLVFRVLQWNGMNHSEAMVMTGAPTLGFAPSTMVRSPLTFGLLYVLVGYYVCYYALVLRKSRHLSAEDIEEGSSAAAPS